ncbi:hypothetical protein M5K25_017252 [Dendrobium thyrsiflorum]|uniref:Uncharacterized protein n=1 Tax=Dendrobium thyrsiflorum TaxID=117978 RepID=A0ABD0UU08_DENTH
MAIFFKKWSIRASLKYASIVISLGIRLTYAQPKKIPKLPPCSLNNNPLSMYIQVMINLAAIAPKQPLILESGSSQPRAQPPTTTAPLHSAEFSPNQQQAALYSHSPQHNVDGSPPILNGAMQSEVSQLHVTNEKDEELLGPWIIVANRRNRKPTPQAGKEVVITRQHSTHNMDNWRKIKPDGGSPL